MDDDDDDDDDNDKLVYIMLTGVVSVTTVSQEMHSPRMKASTVQCHC